MKMVNLNAPLEVIRFVVPDVFPAGYFAFFGAREGVGKTTILAGLLWQMSRPNGGEFLGWRVPHGSSIYVNTDAPDGQSRTVRHWLEKHRAAYPDGDLSKISVIEPIEIGLAPGDLESIREHALGNGVQAIVIDSYMGAFPGQDINRLEQTMMPLSGLRELAARTKAAVIVTDHIPKRAPGEKDGDRGIMGSVAKSSKLERCISCLALTRRIATGKTCFVGKCISNPSRSVSNRSGCVWYSRVMISSLLNWYGLSGAICQDKIMGKTAQSVP